MAAEAAYRAGYRRLDAYSPMPIEGLAAAVGKTTTRLPLIALLGGIAGGIGGYALQYYVALITYPLNVGGRPLHSWPAFIPATFETTVLGAATAIVLGMLALNGLPRPHHPLFNVEAFKLASRDRFFLCLEASDPLFDLEITTKFLEDLAPRGLWEVPR